MRTSDNKILRLVIEHISNEPLITLHDFEFKMRDMGFINMISALDTIKKGFAIFGMEDVEHNNNFIYVYVSWLPKDLTKVKDVYDAKEQAQKGDNDGLYNCYLELPIKAQLMYVREVSDNED